MVYSLEVTSKFQILKKGSPILKFIITIRESIPRDFFKLC